MDTVNKEYVKAESLFLSGNFSKSERLCAKILKITPNEFSALHLLGLNFAKQGKVNEAIKILERAVILNNNHSEINSNLGNFYLVVGRVEDAIESCRNAIRIDPSNGFAFHHLGSALLTLNRLDEAEQAFRQAIEYVPCHPHLLHNMGLCMARKGNLMEAVQWFLKANEQEPSLGSVYVSLFHTLMFMHNTEDVARVAAIALEGASLSEVEKIELISGLARVFWVTGKLEQVKNALDQGMSVFSVQSSPTNERIVSNLREYHHYLYLLHKEREMYPQLYDGEPDQALFFVGDSHCLSPSETVIIYREHAYRILSALIIGCKIWHLSRDESNIYKASLGTFCRAIPNGSLLVIGFGEIDCRVNEGILPAYLNKGIDYQKNIPVIVHRYLDFVESLARVGNHRLIIYGVPAPSEAMTSSVEGRIADLLVEIIRLVNTTLRDEAFRRCIDFLDVYAATKDEFGQSNRIYHIDPVHLHPRTVMELFESFLISRRTN